MPIYEYVCTDCGAETEVIQRFSDPPLERCASCSGNLRKKISPSAFHLKGTGWYKTDYAGKGGSNGTGGNDKPKEEAKSDSGASDKSTDTKPAASPSSTSTSATPTKDT